MLEPQHLCDRIPIADSVTAYTPAIDGHRDELDMARGCSPTGGYYHLRPVRTPDGRRMQELVQESVGTR